LFRFAARRRYTVVFAILLTVTNTSTVTAASPSRQGTDGTLGARGSHVAVAVVASACK
jgi:hypothetical protein